MEITLRKKTGVEICDFCHIEKGKTQHLGLAVVKLKEVDVFGTKKKACQNCAKKYRAALDSRYKMKSEPVTDIGLHYLRKLTSALYSS
ncbi:MAG: hypothetical protein RLN81_00045 [Balneolaceae bacterium]